MRIRTPSVHCPPPIAIVVVLLGCLLAPNRAVVGQEHTNWVGTWATSLQLTEPHNLPPPPGLTGSTLRQVLRVSTGGPEIRLAVSNLFGDGPLIVHSASIANSLGSDRIDPHSSLPLTFSGAPGVTLSAGESRWSDPIRFSLQPGSEVAVSMWFGETPADVTGHPGSRTTSFLTPGDATTAAALPGSARTDHWYVLSGMDVKASGGTAVAILGDSITDGRGSGTNRQNRWPDELAGRLAADPHTATIGVLNHGIGGNCVRKNCLGPSAMERFERDVLGQSGVRYLIILEGVNDLGTEPDSLADRVATGLISAFADMALQAHTRGIKVFGATILPFGDSFYDGPGRREARQKINAWIRSTDAFDAVIDFDAALRDPEVPARMRTEAHTGDYLHPNENGYRIMAAAVDLALFHDSEEHAETRWRISDEALPGTEVRAVLPDSRGRLWLGTRDGLFMRTGDTIVRFSSRDGMVSDGVSDLTEADDGTIWVTGGGGFSTYDDAGWRAFDTLGDLQPRVVFSANRGADGAIWLAANGGASSLDAGTWTHYPADLGLPHRVVHAALRDRSGTVWFACRRGLVRLTGHRLKCSFTPTTSAPLSKMNSATSGLAPVRAGSCTMTARYGPGTGRDRISGRRQSTRPEVCGR